MRRGHPVHQRIGGPRCGVSPLFGRARHDLELVHARRTLAVRGAQAVRAGVATADDHHPLVFRGDGRLSVGVEHGVAVGGLIGPRQVFHRLKDTGELPARDGQVAPVGGATGQHHGVELLAEFGGGDIDADVHTGPERGAFGRHLLESAVDVALLHLEFGDAVAQQTADAVGPFEHRDVMAGAGQLLGRGQPGWTGSDDGDGLPGHHVGSFGNHPALIEGVVDDLDLDLLDGHRIGVDAEHTGGLTRGRAQPPGELREVVGGVQPVDRILPTVPVDQVVPLRDEVAQRTAVVAERDSAIHTPRCLLLQGSVIEVLIDLVPVAQTQRHRPTLRCLPAGDLHEAAGISHGRPP